MSPEDMVRAYDTMALADVYAVVAFYLLHGDAVREYMKRRDEKARPIPTSWRGPPLRIAC